MFDKRIENGLRVILIPNQHQETVGVSLTGKIGSMRGLPGISHFMEHLVLCATKKYPDFTSLANSLDEFGIQRNAFTSFENMKFVFKALPEHLPQIFGFLLEIICNPLLLETDIEKQRKIITQEIRKAENDLVNYSRVNILKSLYGTHGPGVPLLGNENDVSAINREQLVDFFKKHFVAGNFIVVVTGKFNENTTFNKIKETLGNIPRGQNEPLEKQLTQPGNTKIVQRDGLKQSMITLAWPAYCADDTRTYAAYMLRCLLVEGRMSRLWQELRQQNALVYSITGTLSRQNSFGNLIISTGTAHEDVDTVIFKIKEEFKKIASEFITDTEYMRLKNIVKTSLIFEADSAFELSEYYANKIAADNTFNGLKEELEKYNSVTKDDIKKVASELSNTEPHIFIVAPNGK